MGSQRQVLIVEDNYLLLDMLTGLCGQKGIAVVSASSGEAAIATIRREGARIALLFTDIRLPGLIDGWTLAEAYRTLVPNGAVIYASTTGRIDRRSVSGSIFVGKPFRIHEVVDLVALMMDPSAPHEAPRVPDFLAAS